MDFAGGSGLVDMRSGAGQQQTGLADLNIVGEVDGGGAAVVGGATGGDHGVLLHDLHSALHSDSTRISPVKGVTIQYQRAGSSGYYRKRGFHIAAAAVGVDGSLLLQSQFLP